MIGPALSLAVATLCTTRTTWHDCDWNVVEREGKFYLEWAFGTVFIGGGTLTWELAVDAACEFMDRFDRSQLPPDTLMGVCVRNAVEQE
ncbi:MAG: hypothetical protein IT435_02300 [Phycisphaerales bacterium]|nr:hypothetical protein [Phycisphaerales bacterium]